MTRLGYGWTVVRGALIGMAEAVPGVSGGTIALITGIYETVVSSGSHLVGGLRKLPVDRAAARRELGQVSWLTLLLLLVGMVPGLLLAAALLGPLVEEHPVLVSSVFLGMTVAALLVPITMVGRAWRVRDVGLAVVVAVVVFLLLGLPPQQLPTVWPVILVAAGVAACALALPGVSGSFLLLTLGLYQPTLAAVNERDLGYLAVFGAGVVLGLALFVRGLQWLLGHRRRVTLVVLTGVIAGALRGVWPWQDGERTLLAPDDRLALAIPLFLAGAAVVLGLMWIGRRVDRIDPTSPDPERLDPGRLDGGSPDTERPGTDGGRAATADRGPGEPLR